MFFRLPVCFAVNGLKMTVLTGKHLGHSIAVVAFVIEVGGEDALLTSIFDYVERAALPGNHTLTKPLVFKDIEHHLHSNKYYQSVDDGKGYLGGI